MNGRSHLSGKGTIESIFNFINHVFEQVQLIGKGQIVMRHSHSSDMNPICKNVLLHHHYPNRCDVPSCQHVFGPLEARLDTATSDMLALLRPTEGMTREQRGECYEVMKQYLHRGALEIFKPTLKQFCLKHNDYCNVFDNPFLENCKVTKQVVIDVADGIDVAEVTGGSASTVVDVADGVDVAEVAGGGASAVVEKLTVEHPQTGEPLKVLSCGFICVDHAPYGRMTGYI